MFDAMLRRLIEFPSRDALLAVVERDLLASVARDKDETEREAGRPIGVDVVGEVRSLVDQWRSAPLPVLAANCHFLIWAWMDKNRVFRSLMIGDDRDIVPWWRIARDMVKTRFNSGLVDWPAHLLHETQELYDPRCCRVEDLYALLLGLYVLHCS